MAARSCPCAAYTPGNDRIPDKVNIPIMEINKYFGCIFFLVSVKKKFQLRIIHQTGAVTQRRVITQPMI
jgi:hypothetical protein